jgi:hypothetical protein
VSQTLMIRPVGLDNFHNQLSVAPPGSFLVMDDVVIDREGVVESRRGLSRYGSLGTNSTAIPQQLLYYKNTILGMIANTLYFDTGMQDDTGNEIYNAFSGSFQEVSPGLRVKFVESNGNLYFTTLNGIQKLGAVTAADFNTSPNLIVPAGVVPAISNEAWIDYTSSGWFNGGSAVGYETLWGIQDLNTNVLLGDPSSVTQLTSDPTVLLINGLNQILFTIDDTASISTSSKVYWDNFNLNPASDDATDLYNDLISLSAQLDIDFATANYSGMRNIQSTTPLFFFVADTTASSTALTSITATNGFVTGTPIYDANYNLISTIASVDSTTEIHLTAYPGATNATGVGFYYGAFNSSLTLPQTLITTSTAHNLLPGQEIDIEGSSVGALDGTQNVVSTPTATSVIVNLETTAASVAVGTIQLTTAVEYQKNTPPQEVAIGSDITNLQNFLNGIVAALAQDNVFATYPNTSSNAIIKINIPSGITTSHFYQVYRTSQFPQPSTGTLSSIVIDSEYKLVYEGNPTGTDIANGYVVYRDVTSETFRDSGTPLYTNPNTGQGASQTNDRPPLAADIALFNQNVFYANTSTRHSIEFNLVSVENLNSSSYFKVSEGISTNIYNFAVGAQQVQSFVVSNAASLGGKYFTLSSARNRTNYYAWYDPSDQYVFTVTSANATAGAIYTSTNGQSFTVLNTITAGTTLTCSGTGEPGTFGTLTLEYGTGDATITYSSDTNTEFEDPGLTNPALAGLTGLVINIRTIDSNAELADKTVSALATISDFQPTILGATSNTVQLILTDEGPATAAANGTTSFAFSAPSIIGAGENEATKTVLISSSPSVGTAIDETAQSLIRVINANPNEVVYAYYLSSASTLPGIIYLQRKDLLNIPVYLTVDSVATSQEFTPAIQVAFTGTTTANSALVTNVSNTTGFEVGTVMSAANIPSYTTLFSVNGATSITLNQVASSSVTNEAFGYGAATVTNNQVQPNALFYSKDNQPEAVPLLNFVTVGPKDKAILRIIALRESLMIFKEDAIYRLTGTSAETGWTVSLFDSSTLLLAPDTAGTLNNQIYIYSNQGVAVVSETGVSIVSRPIERDLLRMRQYDNYSTIMFGITYEADRAFLLFGPTVNGDTVATQCYRYNTFTQSWTRLVLTKNCGVVLPIADILYLGDGESNFINQERKTYTRTDYADTSYPNDLLANTINTSNYTMYLGDVTKVSVGDVVVQTQYLTISQFNRLLAKLDIDANVPSQNYVSLLTASYGDDMYKQLVLLAAKLDVDLSTTAFTTIVAGYIDNFVEQQEAFNAVIDQLNISNLQYNNYQQSTGTVTYDSNITAIAPSNSGQITIGTLEPFIAGALLTYEHINCQVVTTPQFFGNPGVFRQCYEATFVFESSDFIGGTMGFCSDLFPVFDYQTFGDDGIGVWGEMGWSGALQGMVWGGLGTGVPVRTYIPRDKQRCRWLEASFQHAIAWDQFAFYGITLTYNDYSTRAYR